MRQIALCAIALLAPLPVGAADLASAWAGIPEAEVRIVAGAGAGDGQPWLALEFAMAADWKVYWRNPGDAGLPPVPDWSASTGVSIGDLSWPRPERAVSYGLETFVYHDRVVLPVEAARTTETESSTVRLHLSYGACADVCVPVEAKLYLELPAGPLPVNRHGKEIASAMRTAPERRPDLLAGAPRLLADGSVRFRLSPAAPVPEPDAIIEGPASAVFSRPACASEGTHLICIARVSGRLPRDSLLGQPLTITLFGGPRPAEATAPLSQ